MKMMTKLLLTLLLLLLSMGNLYALSPEIRFDMLKTKLAGQLKADEHKAALQTMEAIKELGVSIPKSFAYFEGKALFESGQKVQAYKKLEDYVSSEGKKGKYYSKAIAYMVKAEEAYLKEKRREDARRLKAQRAEEARRLEAQREEEARRLEAQREEEARRLEAQREEEERLRKIREERLAREAKQRKFDGLLSQTEAAITRVELGAARDYLDQAAVLNLDTARIAALRQKIATTPGTLTFEIQPASAKVRFLDTAKKYVPGMSMPPGRYQLEVSAAGYIPSKGWVVIAPGDRIDQVVILEKLPIAGDTYTEPTTGMEFVYVPGGCFQMGSPESEKGRDADELQHEVCLDGFWMGKYEVTMGQYRYSNPKFNNKALFIRVEFGKEMLDAISHPYPTASWAEAALYSDWLATKTDRGFRLPTEAEWEYAARAGTKTSYYWEDDMAQACNYANMRDKTYFKARKKGVKKSYGSDFYKLALKKNCDDGYETTSPIGSFKPNNFGLYDMLGNVSEWCSDWYAEDYYTLSPRHNPQGPSSGAKHVLRGGGWISSTVWATLLPESSRGKTKWTEKNYFLTRIVRAANRMTSLQNDDSWQLEGGFRLAFSEVEFNTFGDKIFNNEKVENNAFWGLAVQEHIYELPDPIQIYDFHSDGNIMITYGVLVTHVEPVSPAGVAGLMPGDLIREISHSPVTANIDVEKTFAKIRNKEDVYLEIVREKKIHTVIIHNIFAGNYQ